jgi:hypothetical protein
LRFFERVDWDKVFLQSESVGLVHEQRMCAHDVPSDRRIKSVGSTADLGSVHVPFTSDDESQPKDTNARQRRRWTSKK